MDLIDAVINNDVTMVKKLLSEGANPNMLLDHARITPLHFAAQNNSLDVVPILMQAGADPHAQVNPEGYTPLHLAKLFKHREMIAMLHFYSRRIY